MVFRAPLALACLSLPLAAASDLTGHWTIEASVNSTSFQLECDLRQEGVKLEGACKSANTEIKLAGEVSDPKVRFSYAVDYQGSTYTLYYSGTLDSNSAMKGEIEVSGTTGSFSAKKDGRK